jgi:hypothetical protein
MGHPASTRPPARTHQAGPCRTLTGDDLVAAIATLRPAKNHSKPYPRGNEKCLFDKCGRAGRKQPSDYLAFIRSTDEDHRWDKDRHSSSHAVADRHLKLVDGKRRIDVPEGWSRNSFADELMTLKSKRRLPNQWGEVLFGKRLVYGTQSLLDPIHVDRSG